jgi:hypothetical protein
LQDRSSSCGTRWPLCLLYPQCRYHLLAVLHLVCFPCAEYHVTQYSILLKTDSKLVRVRLYHERSHYSAYSVQSAAEITSPKQRCRLLGQLREGCREGDLGIRDSGRLERSQRLSLCICLGAVFGGEQRRLSAAYIQVKATPLVCLLGPSRSSKPTTASQ